LSLLKHLKIKFKLGLIQFVYSFHILHTFLKNLHFFLEFDLLFCLIIGILGSNFLKLFKIVVFTLAFLRLIVRLKFGVLPEKLGNFLTVSLDDFTSFPNKGSFNVFNLVVVVLTHVIELLSHGLNELIDVIILLLDSLDVLLIFVFELVDESLDKNVFLLDDLLACFLLNLDISS
jgi:hypothetical protein